MNNETPEMMNEPIVKAIMKALTRKTLNDIGMPHIQIDDTLLAMMCANYTFQYLDGEFQLLKREKALNVEAIIRAQYQWVSNYGTMQCKKIG